MSHQKRAHDRQIARSVRAFLNIGWLGIGALLALVARNIPHAFHEAPIEWRLALTEAFAAVVANRILAKTVAPRLGQIEKWRTPPESILTGVVVVIVGLFYALNGWNDPPSTQLSLIPVFALALSGAVPLRTKMSGTRR